MTMAEDTFASVKFSTRGLPPRRRVAAYREMIDRSIGCSDVTTTTEEFDFRANSLVLPGFGVAQIKSTGIRVEQSGYPTVDPKRDVVLAVIHEGAATCRQRGREVTVNGGGAFLFPTDVVSHVFQRTASRLTIYSMARRELAPAVSNLDCTLLTPLDPAAMRLLTGYTDLLLGDGSLASAELRRLAVSHVHDLIALAIGATREAAEMAKARGLRGARRAELYARANRLIALGFDDPDLAPGEMAHRLRVSPRHLQKIFAERGETVMTRLWGERVTRAARLLSAPDAADRTVTDIAFACGFNDSSHFGRVFAERRGMTPSQWRKQARAPSAIEVESPPDRRAYN